MKKPAATASLFIGILLAPAVFTEAATERVTVREDGIKFLVNRYEGRRTPYRVRFSTSTTGSSFFYFKESGEVSSIKAGTERYVVRYRSSGALRKVIRKDSGARMLVGDEDLDGYNEDADEDAVEVVHRSLYACDDCEEKWNTVCGEGISTVCNLVDHPSLGIIGTTAVKIMCDTFGSACSSISAEEVCEGSCVAEPTPGPTAAPTTPAPTPGPTAEPPSGACSLGPCLNGGSCAIDGGGGHVCSCPSGFGGMACQTSTASLAPFYIEVEYLGTWTNSRRAVFQSAADRWADVITHVPCGGALGYPAGRLLISATLQTIDGQGGTLGSAGPTGVWTACPTISATGAMTFDIDDIAFMEAFNIFEGVILHEMGHVIGTGTLWGDCSTCRSDGNSNWKCPAALAAYNDLKNDPEGTDANIIELDGSTGTRCGHFDEVIFDDELMTGYVDSIMHLSKMTAASLDDTGYIVDASMVDPYTLPSMRSASIVTPAEGGFMMEDIAVEKTIYLIGEDGEITGEMEGVEMQF